MVAHPLPPAAAARAGENVEPSLKPGVNALRDLNGFMPGMIRGRHAIFGDFTSFSGKVAVQLDHG